MAEILSASTQFAIPLYQRDYTWGREESDELIDDLLNHQEPVLEKVSTGARSELFLGNFIFESSKDGKTYIVDGQQRLTTILLLLVACRRRALELGMHQVAGIIQQRISFTHPTEEGISLGCRLATSESIREVFEVIADPKWDGVIPDKIGKKPVKLKSRKIRPIYQRFLEHVSTFDQKQLSRFLNAIYSSYVFSVKVESNEEALSIFERTNARGQDLEISDLLKNYLFANKVEGIDPAWKLILANAGGTILRMLKYFYVSKKGYVLKPQLYKLLKTYGDAVGPQQLTQSLADFSKFYRLVKSADEPSTKAYFDDIELTALSTIPERYQRVFLALQGLREFNVVQFCPAAFAAIECLVRNGGKEESGHAKKLAQLFEAFENYHFINNAVCERVGNEVEQLYADTSEEYAKESSNFFKITDRLINQLRSKLASEAEFQAKFIEICYPEQSSLILYIFDRFNRHDVHVGQATAIYDSTPNLKRRNYNIEHFLAQKFKEDAKDKKGSKEKADTSYIDNIGNLLPIHHRDNSALGSETPLDKIKLLTGELEKGVQCLPFLSEFATKYSVEATTWDKAKIQARAQELAQRAYKEVWRIK